MEWLCFKGLYFSPLYAWLRQVLLVTSSTALVPSRCSERGCWIIALRTSLWAAEFCLISRTFFPHVLLSPSLYSGNDLRCYVFIQVIIKTLLLNWLKFHWCLVYRKLSILLVIQTHKSWLLSFFSHKELVLKYAYKLALTKCNLVICNYLNWTKHI